jgi:hypothetical protein
MSCRLFLLAGDLNIFHFCFNIDAIISLVVVLPELPATAITGFFKMMVTPIPPVYYALRRSQQSRLVPNFQYIITV